MKKSFHYLVIASFTIGIFLTSCVSNKKFAVSQAKVEKLQNDSVAAQGKLKECNINVNNLYADKTYLLNEYALVQSDLASLTTESKTIIADQSKRLKSLQSNLQAQKDVMEKLKNSIADALMNYKADELTVHIKDGNVYVSLAEKVLFKSGSDNVDPNGKKALKSLVEVIKSTKDITVLIEGHTDNVPIKTTQFKDNWELSTARASSIVRIMTTDYGFDSNRITASGKSQFHPIQTNATVDGRAANRRTEIILSPNLNELYDLLY